MKIAPIEFTHAVWKTKLGAPITVFVEPTQVFSWFYMPENDATAILSTGGGHVIVSETPEEVGEKLTKKETSNEQTS